MSFPESGSGLPTRTTAVVFESPGKLALCSVELSVAGPADLVVDISHSGISTGTERLLWTGRMPPFPGMGYPLVPGYESVGTVVDCGSDTGFSIGDHVFVPGANCYGPIRGLFGGAAARVVVPAARALAIDPSQGEAGVLLALAATAHHALVDDAGLAGSEVPAATSTLAPDLIIGHGVVGRLLARIALALGHPPPTVWEADARRRQGAVGYPVIDPADDDRRDYRVICDASGDASIIDELVSRMAPRGRLVLAGFYADRIGFDFAPAFARGLRLRIAAEWRRPDLLAVNALAASGHLSLAGLITHRQPAAAADLAYATAFGDPDCLKMTLDWRGRL